MIGGSDSVGRSHPRSGFFSLHSRIGPEGLAKLEKVFREFHGALFPDYEMRKQNPPDSVADKGVAAGDKADADSLQPEGFVPLS
jgi:hypothetical protein